LVCFYGVTQYYAGNDLKVGETIFVIEHLKCIECQREWDWERPPGRRGAGPPICSDKCRKNRLRRFRPIRPKVAELAALAVATSANPEPQVRLQPGQWPWSTQVPVPEPEASQAEPGESRVGQPPHVPTPEQRQWVQDRAGNGASPAEIAFMAGLSEVTVQQHYHDELIRGPAVANDAVATNLRKIASEGTGSAAVSAAKVWLLCRGGWSEYAAGAPKPVAPEQPAALGKKAMADKEAQTAAVGTGWADLVRH
jgi:hypothetical protein